MELRQQFEELCTQLFKQYKLSVDETDNETRIRIEGNVRGEAQLPFVIMRITLHWNNLYVSKFRISAKDAPRTGGVTTVVTMSFSLTFRSIRSAPC